MYTISSQNGRSAHRFPHHLHVRVHCLCGKCVASEDEVLILCNVCVCVCVCVCMCVWEVSVPLCKMRVLITKVW